MLLNLKIDKFDLNNFISVLWRPICSVYAIQYELHQQKFICQHIIIWDFSSSWNISALIFAAHLCIAKMLGEECTLNSSSKNSGMCPVIISCNSNCTLKMSGHFKAAFLFLCAFVAGGDDGGLGAAEAVVLYLDRGNHSIFAEQACARKLSYILFWH